MVTFPNGTNADGIWNLNQVRDSELSNNWPITSVQQFVPSNTYTAEASTLLLVTTNGSVFSDSEGNTITNNGATHQNDSPTGSGYSINVEGTDGGLEIPTVASSNFGTGDFTYEAWVKLTDLSKSWHYVVGHTYATGGGALYIRSTAEVNYYEGGTKAQGNSGAGRVVSLNTWHHVAAVNSGGNLTLYLDGYIVDTADISTRNITDTNLYVGQNQSDGEELQGYIYKPHVLSTAKY